MWYVVLGSDYDGTLASHGKVAPETIAALERVVASGRRLVLLTGRQLPDLEQVFPRMDLFARVVAENGALLYRPSSRETKRLADPPPEAFLKVLRERKVAPLSIGEVIVATSTPHETTVLEAIRDLGLELQVIFNKGAVMVLPAGVNKGTGLAAALGELELSAHNVVGIGDAENDHAFLRACDCAVAVANALPMVKEQADFVTGEPNGAGVAEVAGRLVADDLRELAPLLTRHDIVLGAREDGEEVRLRPHGVSVLIAGPSGGGKSTAAVGIVERLAEQGYQLCLVDPEGDYVGLPQAVSLGDRRRAPRIAEVLELLRKPAENVAVNLLGVRLKDRPAYFADLLANLQEMRARTGRPHWMILDEAHHLLPSSWAPAPLTLPKELKGMIMLTVSPREVAPAALAAVDVVIAVGDAPDETIRGFAEAIGVPPPEIVPRRLERGEAVAWFRESGVRPFAFHVAPPREILRRHRRKYAVGALGPDKSFYFRGPRGDLNLRAQNLQLFMQTAEGVDDATWTYHLRRGDYARWLREAIKDEALADEVAQVERRGDLSPRESRELVRAAIERRYTGAADSEPAA